MGPERLVSDFPVSFHFPQVTSDLRVLSFALSFDYKYGITVFLHETKAVKKIKSAKNRPSVYINK